MNFFDNDFSEDMGDLLFGRAPEHGTLDLMSPDNTSDGVIRKRWKIVDGKRCLVKGGTGQNMQEPFNEAIASMLMDSQGIDHVGYRLAWSGKIPVSVCEDFVGKHTELVTAHGVCRIPRKANDASLYSHYVRICDSLGIDVVPSLDRMIVIDYIMANRDRHLGNFGLVRDADPSGASAPHPCTTTGRHCAATCARNGWNRISTRPASLSGGPSRSSWSLSQTWNGSTRTPCSRSSRKSRSCWTSGGS